MITWYHRQFIEVTNDRYLTDKVREQFHKGLAEYFQVTNNLNHLCMMYWYCTVALQFLVLEICVQMISNCHIF